MVAGDSILVSNNSKECAGRRRILCSVVDSGKDDWAVGKRFLISKSVGPIMSHLMSDTYDLTTSPTPSTGYYTIQSLIRKTNFNQPWGQCIPGKP